MDSRQSIVAALVVVFIICLIWVIVALQAPADDEALRVSIDRAGLKALALAVIVDPSFCHVKGRVRLLPGGDGRVECLNFPRHLFVDKVLCDDRRENCQPLIERVPECLDYRWDLSLLAYPRSDDYPIGPRTHSTVWAGSLPCDRGWTVDAVRLRLAELNLRVEVHKVLNVRVPTR